ncbi:MAG TPA: hypothetical protein VMC06_09260 [Opitutaceae bacterium]|nr:hypothetical protein [Opitutaceae bacterium]
MSRPSRQPSLPHRLTAVLGIALVLLLNVLVASPQLHAWLHGHEPAAEHNDPGHAPVGSADHECAVTLFAHGATSLPFLSLLLLVWSLTRGTVLHPSEWLIAARPRYWLVPSHAPPLA